MSKKYVYVFLCVFCLSRFLAAPLEAEEAQDTGEQLANIDGQPITREELETFFNAFFDTRKIKEKIRELPDYQQEAVMARGRSKAFQELVRRRLLLDAAREEFTKNKRIQNVVDKLTEERAERMRKAAGSHIAFMKDLHDRGLSLERWKEYVRETILIQNYLYKETNMKSRVRPSTMRRYYEENKQQFQKPRTIVYRMILIDPDKCREGEKEQGLARRIRERLHDGAEFARVAEEYSIDRDRTEGGLHRVEAPESDSGWLPPACRGLEPGEISPVQHTESGCRITKLERIIPARVAPFKDVQEDIRRRLLKNRRREARKQLVQSLRQEATVEILPPGKEIIGS